MGLFELGPAIVSEPIILILPVTVLVESESLSGSVIDLKSGKRSEVIKLKLETGLDEAVRFNLATNVVGVEISSDYVVIEMNELESAGFTIINNGEIRDFEVTLSAEGISGTLQHTFNLEDIACHTVDIVKTPVAVSVKSVALTASTINLFFRFESADIYLTIAEELEEEVRFNLSAAAVGVEVSAGHVLIEAGQLESGGFRITNNGSQRIVAVKVSASTLQHTFTLTEIFCVTDEAPAVSVFVEVGNEALSKPGINLELKEQSASITLGIGLALDEGVRFNLVADGGGVEISPAHVVIIAGQLKSDEFKITNNGITKDIVVTVTAVGPDDESESSLQNRFIFPGIICKSVTPTPQASTRTMDPSAPSVTAATEPTDNESTDDEKEGQNENENDSKYWQGSKLTVGLIVFVLGLMGAGVVGYVSYLKFKGKEYEIEANGEKPEESEKENYSSKTGGRYESIK